jgi:hypothetical protein
MMALNSEKQPAGREAVKPVALSGEISSRLWACIAVH